MRVLSLALPIALAILMSATMLPVHAQNMLPELMADFTEVTPLRSSSAMSGDMFTHETELLTPRGIIDEPAPITLTYTGNPTPPDFSTLEPAAGEPNPLTPSSLTP